MHQTATTSSTATLTRLDVANPVIHDRVADVAAAPAEHRAPVLPYPMEEPDAGPEERRVPLLVSASVLLVFSLSVWVGLIWLAANLLG